MTSEQGDPGIVMDGINPRVPADNDLDRPTWGHTRRSASGYVIEFQVLGPTEARQSGESVPLSGARRRALVTRLLLDAGRAVSAQTLVDDVWGDQPPRAASATLQSHVSQLRKVLGDRVQRTAAGYMVCLDAARIDAAEFEGKVASGLSQFADDNLEAAARSLSDALQLWREGSLRDAALLRVLAKPAACP